MLCCCDTVEPPVTGACCEGAVGGIGICNERTQADCQDNNGDYQGDGTTCNPNPCPSTAGACCYDDGSCETTEAVRCTARGGTYQGDGTTCSPNPCPQPTGACCDFDGSCEPDVTEATCEATGRVWQGADTVCNPNPCPQPGPCQFCDAGNVPAPLNINIQGVSANPNAAGFFLREQDAATWINAQTVIARNGCSHGRSQTWNDVNQFGGAVTTSVEIGFGYEVGAQVQPFMTIVYRHQEGATFCGFLWRADFPLQANPYDCTAPLPLTGFTIRAANPGQPGGIQCPGVGPGDVPLLMGEGEQLQS